MAKKPTLAPWVAHKGTFYRIVPEDCRTEGGDIIEFIGCCDQAEQKGLSETEQQQAEDRDYANAEHVVACVNGCHNLNPSAVPDMLRCLRQSLLQLSSLRSSFAEGTVGYVEAGATIEEIKKTIEKAKQF